MATAFEKLESTSEKENYQRLNRLIVDGCTALLRDLFDSIIPPSRLTAVLATNQAYLKTHAKLTRVQCQTLYPPSGAAATSGDFDITLLFSLLRHICNLTEPPTGWDAVPEVDNYSVEAELARIKFHRNTLQHARDTKTTEADFEWLWQDITAAMFSLARKLNKEQEWREAINKLFVDPLTVKDGSIQDLKDAMKSAVSSIETTFDSGLLQLKTLFEQRCSQGSENGPMSTFKEKRTFENAKKTTIDLETFYEACREGTSCQVETFIRTNGKPLQRAVRIGTQLAASCGRKGITEYLLDRGGDKNFTDENGWSILHHAARGGNSELVRTLLDRYRRMKVDSKSTSGLTPLHIAAQHGKVHVIDILLSKGADVTAVDDSGMNALHFVSQGGDTRTIERFVLSKKPYKDSQSSIPTTHESLMKAASNGNHDGVARNCEEERKMVRSVSQSGRVNKAQKILPLIDINSKTSKGLTPLHIAARNGNLDAVNFLLNHGADKAEVSNNKWTVLHYAAQGGNTEIIEILLKHEMGVNSRSGNGSTPLHIAALNGHLDALNLLIDHDADHAAVTKNSWTVLHFACKGWNTDVIKRLLDLPTDIDCRNSEGSTPIHIAALNGNLKAVNVLIAHHANKAAVTRKRWTILHCAAQRGNIDTIKKVLELSDDINSQNDDGSTPLHIAALYGNLDAVNCLIDNGANETAFSKNGWTVLHFAAHSGNTATIERLLELNIAVNCQNREGLTPLHIAALNGNLDAVNCLIDNGADETAFSKNGSTVLHYAADSGNTATIERLLELKLLSTVKTERG